ncbi:MAG: DUF1465 family protein [Alphaproteobacteria bacterium]|nr:DUF1465 family protein [Alphaproteobacteria bacterium]
MLFISPSYSEVLNLLIEFRDYLASEYGRSPANSDYIVNPLHSLELNCETSRLTTRLLVLMSWLMVMRAAAVGEIPLSAAVNSHPQLALNRTISDLPRDPSQLPRVLVDISNRSYQVFLRLARLESSLREMDERARNQPANPSPKPVSEGLQPEIFGQMDGNIIPLFPKLASKN